MPAITWDSKVATVAGRSAPRIEKAFGIRTVGDLLSHYPRRYVDKGSLSDLGTIEPDEHVSVIAEVVEVSQHTYQDRRTHRQAYRLEVVVATADDRLRLTFFDAKRHLADWRRSSIRVGRTGLFSGKVGRFGGKLQLTNPQSRIFGSSDEEGGAERGPAQAQDEWDRLPQLLTIYPATSTVQTWQIESAIATALDLLEEVPEVLPPEVRETHRLVGAREALRGVHRPESWPEQQAALRRLRFDEAFVTQTVLAQRRAALVALDTPPRSGRAGGLLDRFDERLPFTLTAGQRQVSTEILEDLAQGHPMHRLLQGEVGSGKTVVALRAMLRVVDSGAQAALLAPTEVLAQQHRRSLSSLLGDLAAGGMFGGADDATRLALLTGSSTAAARREALLDAQSGQAGIVVGTHALLEERVGFADLGLVVVDEQHRFGVEQRAVLTDKATGAPPHVLVMTATPIPRTVAMTVFGDLETSTLAELPSGRQAIATSVVDTADHPAWLDRAWERIREEVGRGRQCYVVCPRIGGDDVAASATETEVRPTAAVEEVVTALAGGPLAGLRVEMLHGRLSGDRKDAVMQAFAAGVVDVLVSTTVIEVGVDVANATTMVILDADRFGVSQLHQLRGRVGRGGHAGLCLLVTSLERAAPGRQRLDAVAATTDGFELSRVDLEQRREGDVLGSSQSGRRSGLRLLSVLRHEDVIREARDAATRVVGQDPTLVSLPVLAERVRRLQESEQADYLERA